jgi:hypothetical protein
MLVGTFALCVIAIHFAWHRWRTQRCAQLFFIAWVWIGATAQVALAMGVFAARFLHFLLPLYVLLVAAGIAILLGTIQNTVRAPRANALTLLGYGAILFSYAILARWSYAHVPALHEVVQETYSRHLFRTHDSDPDKKNALLAVRAQLLPNDHVLSSNPWVSAYYLGRTDGFLRERKQRGSRYFTTYNADRDEYFGQPIYDSIEELKAVNAARSARERLWLVVDYKLNSYASPRYRRFVRRYYPRVMRTRTLTVYRLDDGAPRHQAIVPKRDIGPN